MHPHLDFEDDAFISYGSIDNELLDESGKGWVDNLHERLEFRLGELLGYRPRVWRDPKIPGNVYFVNHLESRLASTVVLVSVLSPGYLKSDWCMKELREFCEAAERNGGLKVEGSLRIFKVVKTHVERDRHPREFQGQLGYEFYQIDQATKKPVEFGQELGRGRDQRYWDKLNDLAWDIKQALTSVKSAAPPPPQQPKAAVYLAETTYDLREARDNIKRELQKRTYEVLPDREIPYKSPDYEQAVRDCVARCKLSVHLIGGSYGIIPEGEPQRSIVGLQNEVAAERSGDPGFSRLLWMPVELEPREERQSQFINYLKTRAEPQKGAELLQTSLEELKSQIQVRLSGNGHKPPQPTGVTKVYLMCDLRDVEGVAAVNECLYERGYEVLLPLLDDAGDAEAGEIHRENLIECDAALIYYGGANQAWYDFKRRDLEKCAGLGRTKPLLCTAVYVTSPQTTHKQLVTSRGAVVIKNFGQFSPERLEPFFERVEAARRG